MRPNRFSGLILIRNSQSRICAGQYLIPTETVEKLHDEKGPKIAKSVKG